VSLGVGARARHRADDSPRYRPRAAWGLWAGSFCLVAGILVVRNAFLFRTALYELADYADDSILIAQARRLTLLVGNYSREHFNHPGPAYLYVQAAGEWLFWSVLHWVPAAWNGQLLATFLLNGSAAACIPLLCARWSGPGRAGTAGGVAGLAVVLGFAAAHPSAYSLNWMPYLYVPMYFTFAVAIASVAAGRVQDAPLAAVAGWFLMEGHVCFLLFVPLLSCAAVAALCGERARAMLAGRGGIAPSGEAVNGEAGNGEAVNGEAAGRAGRQHVVLAVAMISAAFALPVALNLVLHWPGQFGKYLDYTGSSRAGLRGPLEVLRYTWWFWWPGPRGWAVAAVTCLTAGLLAGRVRDRRLRRFLLALLAMDTLSTLGFLAYVVIGVDQAGQHYIGYFYWSGPALAALAIALAGVHLLRRHRLVAMSFSLVAAVVAAAAFAAAPQARVSTNRTDPVNLATGPNTDPLVPAAVGVLRGRSGGKTIVLRTAQNNAWPEMPALLVEAERTGVTACVASIGWEFMVTSQFICSTREIRRGATYTLRLPGPVPPGTSVVFRLRRAIVTTSAK
jgi:hypothetical protein